MFLASSGGTKIWNPLSLMPQLLTLLLTTFIIMVVAISYNKKLKKKEYLHEPRGLILVAEMLIKALENMVIEILGMKYKNLTVYCLYLILYIMIGNIFSILGFDTQMSSYTVVLSMGLVTFIGIYYFGLKYQKLAYFKKFIVNPLELLSQFVPLISITFRLFGNVIGGGIIIGMLYYFTAFIWSHVPVFGPIDMLTLIILPWFHIYFDLFDDSIQAYIFTILTLIYWQSEMKEESSSKFNKDNLDLKREKPQKIKRTKTKKSLRANNQDVGKVKLLK